MNTGLKPVEIPEEEKLKVGQKVHVIFKDSIVSYVFYKTNYEYRKNCFIEYYIVKIELSSKNEHHFSVLTEDIAKVIEMLQERYCNRIYFIEEYDEETIHHYAKILDSDKASNLKKIV